MILPADGHRSHLDFPHRKHVARPETDRPFSTYSDHARRTNLTSSPRPKPGDSRPRGRDLPVSPQAASGTDPSRGLTPAPQAFHLSAGPAAKTRTGRLGYRRPVRIHGPYQE